MISVAASVILGAAIKIGAPIIKGILTDHLGDTAGGVAGTIVDTVAGKLGVPVEQLPSVPAPQIEQAVREVERKEGPELILAHVAAQRESNKLMLAEIEKSGESVWTWAWRPAWMWLLGLLWAYAFVVQPLIKAAFIPALVVIDPTTLLSVTGIFVAFYMGGHTAKDLVGKWQEAKANDAAAGGSA